MCSQPGSDLGISSVDIFAGILVGGRGVRMGSVDKGLMVSPSGAHETLVEYLTAQLSEVVGEVVLSGRQEQQERFAFTGRCYIADVFGECGPLGGLASLLQNGPEAEWCFLLACDMPAFDAQVLERLKIALVLAAVKATSSRVQAVVPRTTTSKDKDDDRLHPTCSVYSRALAREVTQRVKRGDLSMMGLVNALQRRGELLVVDFGGRDARFFRNVNRPQDLVV